METKDQAEFETPQPLTWHKPEMRQLHVALDTTFVTKGGSEADGPTMDRLIGGPVD